MVKIQEHIDKINKIKKHINNSKGKQRLQYIKCLHRLQKQALQCYMYINKDESLKYIKAIK